MGRKKQDPEIRKSEFIEAATKMFFEKGYEATSIRDILKLLGGESPLSPSVFYYYFSSKEELLDTCLGTYIEQYANDINSMIENDEYSYQQKLLLIAENIKKAIGHFISFGIYSIKNEKDLHTLHLQLVNRVFSSISDSVSDLISEGLENGVIPKTDFITNTDPKTVTKLILYGCYIILHNENMCNLELEKEQANLIPIYVAQLLSIK
jgi:AcrR family transcriptional regulator